MRKLKGIDGKLDDAWSKLVKLRANEKCEYCGKTTTLNSHHIFSRSNRSVRWLPDNGVCLCVAHHTFSSSFSAHKTSIEFTDWLYKVKGEHFINDLRIKAHSIGKWSKSEKEQLLRSLNSEILNLEMLKNPPF